MRCKFLAFLLCGLTLFFLAIVALEAHTESKKSKVVNKNQIVVLAKKRTGRAEFQLGKVRYSPGELNYALGQMRLDATTDSEVVVILEDSMALSDIKDVPQMALQAGFRDVRVFVYWKGTGNMAEVFFGPVVKYKLENVTD